MNGRVLAAGLVISLLVQAASARADAPQLVQDQSAHTLPRGSLQVSLFQLSRYGLTDDIVRSAP